MLLLVLRTHSLLIGEKLTVLRKKERKKDQLKQQTNKTLFLPAKQNLKKKKKKEKRISLYQYALINTHFFHTATTKTLVHVIVLLSKKEEAFNT